MKNLLSLILLVSFPLAAFCGAIDRDSSDYYYKIAVQQKSFKNNFEAEKNFKKALEYNPGDHGLRIQYGQLLMEERKYFVACDQFKKILEVDNSHKEALKKITTTSFYLSRWNDVINFGSKIINDTSIKVCYMLGKAYYEEEDYGKAEKFLKQSLAQTATDGEATLLLGKVYIELSNYKEALKLYRVAILSDPDNDKLIYQLGLLYSTINNEKEAVKYIELAAEKGYKVDLDYRENLGMAYLAFDIKKGVEVLKKVLEKKPNDVEIMTQIAQAYYKAGDFQIAADTFNKIYENDATNSKALYMTGIAYMKKGDKALGTSLCEKAIKMDPELGALKNLKYSF